MVKSCAPNSVARVVTPVGQLSQYQYNEDRVQGGHPETLAMQNDLAAILLALFVPWEILPRLFNNSLSVCGDECDAHCNQSSHTGLHACAFVWTRVEPTLPQHVRDFARNIGLLRKSKRDVEVDMMERNAVSAFAMQGSLHLDDDDMDILADVDPESVDDGARVDGSVDDTSLCIASHLVRTRWRDQDGVAAAGIPALHEPWKEFPNLSLDNFTPTAVDTASGFRQDISTETLRQWSDLIKGANVSNTASDALEVTGVTENLINTDNNEDDCDLDADNEYAILEPVLTFTELDSTTSPSVEELAAHLGQHPSALEITDVITKAIPLNAKQKRSVSMLFYHVLRCQGKTTIDLEDQFFLYVGGEGGVGKSPNPE
jgi:hypothetical protein